MMKVRFSLGDECMGTDYSEVIEFPDGTTDEELDKFGLEWFLKYMNEGWDYEVLKEGE